MGNEPWPACTTASGIALSATRAGLHVTSKVWEIIDNISEIVQDNRDIVIMEE